MIEAVRGIILRRKKQNESDSLATVLTDSGALKYVRFHGIQQSKNRSTLLTEPGTHVDLRVHFRDDTNGSVKEGTILERYEPWKKGYAMLALLSSLLEFAEGAAKSFDSNDLFVLLTAWLGIVRPEDRALSAAQSTGIFSAFRFQAMQIAGFIGAHSCAHCGAVVGERAHWEIPEVSFVCEKCNPDANVEHGHYLRTIEQMLHLPIDSLLNSFQDQIHLKNLEHYASICVRHSLPFHSPAADAFTSTEKVGSF
ncbi:MAG: DNA repair protein RecO [Leptospirales bacterium]|nr:DNA repair protein RecO [Leptospirales bacterium]